MGMSMMSSIPLGLMFLISGFFTNVAQVCSLALLPFSKRSYRAVNYILADALWSELVWTLEWWGGVKVKMYYEPEVKQYLGKENALLICNHRSDIDWLVGWLAAKRSGCLGGTKAIMKQSMKYLPVVGWSMYFSEYVFLARNWAQDETTLKEGYRNLKGFPKPFWLALFVEGTRFTKTKLAAAQEYAASVGMPIPQNVLIPRTKGFVSAITNLRDFVPAVYDMTLAISSEAPDPNINRIIQRLPSVVHVRIRRIPMKDLPTSEEGLAAWCRERFVKKDAELEEHKKTNSFGEDLFQYYPRNIGPRLIVIGWALFLPSMFIYLFRNVLRSPRGLLWVFGGVAIVVVVVQILVRASQSDRSKGPAKRTQTNSKKSEVKKETKQKISDESVNSNAVGVKKEN